MTSEAAMNTSTWPYFHFENAWRFRWKSTRREATTSGWRGAPVRICRAMAASDTAIGSCACTTSGSISRSTRAELPAGVDVELASRREPDEPKALAGPPAQLAGFVRDEDRLVPGFRQPGHRHEHLILAAAPGSRGVDVDRTHGRHVRFRVQARRGALSAITSARSLANFRNT